MNLLVSTHCSNEIHLVIGCNSNIAALRVNTILASGAYPILIQGTSTALPNSLQSLISEKKVTCIQKAYNANFLTTLGRAEVDFVVDRVFVTLTLDQVCQKQEISASCRRLRIPVNVSDSPDLSTFTLLSTYSSGDFQMGVTTSGKGCKLASRIKREIVSNLPFNIAEICNRVGELREKIQYIDKIEIGHHDEDAVTNSNLNALVKEFNMTLKEKSQSRARFLSQIVEYYPLEKLAEITMDTLTAEYKTTISYQAKNGDKGIISLVGSGPGSVSMLTIGALQEIYAADLILADKLVPQQLLDVIPKKGTKLFIARKFPGNAEKAQQELLSMGLEALLRGERVVRLKQGDPYIFGRGGEEYLYFSSHGFVPKVLPGITSALAAPVFSSIPATHREVADQVLICTGTSRRGALPNLPEFVKSRTTVFLMALHRIVDLIPQLIEVKHWSADLPAAIVERASCPDQRVIRTALGKVPAAVEFFGSRPPGLLITGFSCGVLSSLSEEDWVVEEGNSPIEISGVLDKLTVPKVDAR